MKRRYLVRSIFVVVVLLPGSWRVAGQEPLRTAADRPVDIQHLRLNLVVKLQEREISGSATIDFVPLRPIDTLRLDAVKHHVAAISDGNGRPLQFQNTGAELLIELGATAAGAKRKVAIEYAIKDPQDGLFFFGPTPAEPNVPLSVWSQGEPISNRYWFPCLDHPNERQTTELVVTVPAGFEVLSNGRLIERRSTDGGVVFHWKQEQPHAAYLVTLVVGKYAIGRDAWREVPVLYYVPPNRAADINRTFGRTCEMLEFFSRKFGTDYPWPKYAQVVVEQFSHGGMENTSATTLHDRVMHDARAILDSSPDGLIAHELGHQWWGDLVTCKDWAHLWLNEGFATYCEVLWAEHKQGPDEAEYLLYKKAEGARSGSARARPIVDRRYPDPHTMFDSRAYPKGGWVLHMLRRRLGDETFFAGLKRYAEAFKYQTVETADLRLIFERLTGQSLERFFYDWTERPGHPELTIDSRYEADAKTVRIALRQTQPQEAFHFPLRAEIGCADQSSPIVLEKEIAEKDCVWYIPAPSRADYVRVDPQHTLLASLRETKSNEWWNWQLVNGGVAERIRAIEHYAESKSDADRKLLAQALANDRFYGVRVEAARALSKSGGDVSRDALIAGLAAEHPKVRRACVDALSHFPGDAKALEALKERIAKGDPSYFVEAALLDAYAKVDRRPASAPFLANLTKSSHNEVIREAALRGLAECADVKSFDTLLEWTRLGKPRNCRVTAIRALPLWLAKNPQTEPQQARVVETVMAYIQGESRPVRRAAVETLGDLGRASRPADRLLASLAEHDADARLRDSARAALTRIRSETPPPLELTRLRDELKELKKANESLQERLHRLEGAARR